MQKESLLREEKHIFGANLSSDFSVAITVFLSVF